MVLTERETKKETKKRLTYKEFILFPNNGKRHELIDGDHYMTPSPIVRHQAISRNFTFFFETYFRNTDKGYIFYAPIDVYLSDCDIVVPDLVVISRENSSIIREKYIKGAPDIIVEILSPTTRKNDLSLKKSLYEKFGVKEYWIANPLSNEVKQYVLKEKKYGLSGSFTGIITSPQLTGLEINLEEVFG